MKGADFLPLAAHLAAQHTEPEWRTAVGRAYYVAFHAARELLEGLGFRVPRADRAHAYHLYVVELDVEELGFDRAEALNRLRTAGIGVNVHYGPVHLMSYYRERFGYSRGLCPIAERMSERILTLPIYPGMSDSDQARVIEAVSGLRA